MNLSDDEAQQRVEADRREVDPPIQVEMATWSKAGQLDWCVEDSIGAWKNGRNRGVAYAEQTAVNGGSGLLIFDRRAAPSHDCWCCESHTTWTG